MIYLPIAEIHASVILILILGGVSGFLSGMLGISGGMIISPTLIILGVDPLCAVASQNMAGIGGNLSGFLYYWSRRDADIKLAFFIFLGGVVGCFIGWFIVDFFLYFGGLAPFMRISYVCLLTTIGVLLFKQSWRQFKGHQRTSLKSNFSNNLPFQTVFEVAKIRVSALRPMGFGVFVGVMASVLGLSGGVLVMPFLTFLLQRSTPIIAGTGLFTGFLVATFVCLFYTLFESRMGDLVLTGLLVMMGGMGSYFGGLVSYKIPRIYIGFMSSACMICLALCFVLLTTPIHSIPTKIVQPLESLNFFYRGLCHLSEYSPLLYNILGIAMSIAFPLGLQWIFKKININKPTLQKEKS
jgi:uncharacterized membrane protein YfcA